MRDGYFIGSNAGIIIYDTSSTKRMYEDELRELCGDVPIVYIKSSSIDDLTTNDALNIIDDLLKKL
jgi:gluconate kinase